MKRHAFDPFSFVLGLAIAALGLFFLLGDRTAADIGWRWMWPIPVFMIGLLFVISAGRRLVPEREAGLRGREGEAEPDYAEPDGPVED
jgi:membrane protein implicated in regulation of membrane protease activity